VNFSKRSFYKKPRDHFTSSFAVLATNDALLYCAIARALMKQLARCHGTNCVHPLLDEDASFYCLRWMKIGAPRPFGAETP